jgi:hypothetical protein
MHKHLRYGLLAAVSVTLHQKATAQLLINELDADQVGTDAGEFVEIVNAGLSGVSLNGISIAFYNGSNDLVYFALDLTPTVTLGPGEYWVLGNAAVPGVDQVFAGNLLQNGQDAVALYNAPALAMNTPVTTANLLDAVVYDTADADDPGLLVLTPGQPQIDEDATQSGTLVSIGRFPDASGGALQTGTYQVMTPTPGLINIPEPAAVVSLLGATALLGLLRRRVR